MYRFKIHGNTFIGSEMLNVEARTVFKHIPSRFGEEKKMTKKRTTLPFAVHTLQVFVFFRSKTEWKEITKYFRFG